MQPAPRPVRSTPPSEPSPQVRAARDQLTRRTRAAVLLAVAGLCLSGFTTGAWGPALLVVCAVLFLGSAACCVAALVSLKRAGARWPAFLMTSLFLLATLYLALSMVLNLVLWNATAAYRDCLHESLTISSSARCQGTLEDSIMRSLTGD